MMEELLRQRGQMRLHAFDLSPQKEKAPRVHDPPGAVVCPGTEISLAIFPTNP
jgi:hypothetical protein